MRNGDADVNVGMVEHLFGTTIPRLPANRCRGQESESGIESPLTSTSGTRARPSTGAGIPTRPFRSVMTVIPAQAVGATGVPTIPNTHESTDADTQTLRL